jgi:hypothetical protein
MAATGFSTLLDVAALDAGVGYPVIDEVIAMFPEVSAFPVETMVGSTIEVSVLKTLPTVGFRNANEGTTRVKPEFEVRPFQTAIIDAQVAVDKQGVVNASKDQARFLMNQAMPFMRSTLRTIAKQIIYGNNASNASGIVNDAKGFPGLVNQYSADSAHEYDVTGTASTTSSVWFLQIAADTMGLSFGNEQTITMSADWKEETVYDSNSKPFQALTNYINGRVGFLLKNKNSAVRIKNIGTATNKTLTDAIMYLGLQKCEELGMQPNLIIGSPRSFEQLRAARTATSPSGAPAPKIREWEGIRVISTINVLNTETAA